MKFLKSFKLIKVIGSLKKCSLTLEIVLEHLEVATTKINQVWTVSKDEPKK